MARFSQGFLSSLGRPAFSESLFDLGAAIGGVPQQMRQKEKQQQFNKLMQQGQAAMAANDAATLARIGQELAAAGYQKEGQQFATASTAAREKQKRQEVAAGLLTGDALQDPTALREAGIAMINIDPEKAIEFGQTAGNLQRQETQKQNKRQAVRGELRGYMRDPRISAQDKLQVSSVLKSLVNNETSVEALEPQIQQLRDRFKPTRTGSRPAPVFQNLMRPNPKTGKLEKRTIRFDTDPITGAFSETDVGLAPPKEFAPKDSDGTGMGEIPSVVEKAMIERSEDATKAGNLLSRNRSLRDSLQAGEAKLTGVLSDLRTSALTFAGMRDKEEEDKTLFLKNRNTDIVNGLPPGVASDKDIEIFSAGFPSENASREEILRYLAAEERILAAQQDMSLIFEQHLEKQVRSGQTASTVGYESKRQSYGIYMGRMLNAMEKEIENNPDQAIEIEIQYAKQMQTDLGFVPSYYR